jgi:ketosteroid isomerase-like protein
MKSGLLGVLACLAVTSLSAYRPSLAAKSAADLAAVEATVRKVDADWAAAARTVSVDAWIAFYAADAVVLLPNDQLAHGKEVLRQSVSRLLAMPRLSVAWNPIKVEVAQSGEQALLIDAYELRFADSRAAPIADRGRRLEVWRKQADGTWKCTVDTWNLDAPIVAAPKSTQEASPTAASSTATLAQTQPPPPAIAPEFGPPEPPRGVASKYGEMPTNYEGMIRKYFLEHLKHPESIQYAKITQPEQGYTTGITGVLLMREKREYGWTVKATINAKDSHDSYVGFKTYTFLFRGEKIIDTRLPLPADEMN